MYSPEIPEFSLKAKGKEEREGINMGVKRTQPKKVHQMKAAVRTHGFPFEVEVQFIALCHLQH